MDYRLFGRTGVQVSALALGTMNFGGRTPEAEAFALLDAAATHGINLIDTADVYGHDPDDFAQGRGRSETIIGRYLRARGGRERWVLASKAHFPMSGDINDRGSSRRHLITACEASLRRLGTDYLDLYQLHHPSNEVPIDETLRALDDLVRQGKVRYLGSSSFGAWQIVESLWVAKEYGLNRLVSEQPAYNLLDRRIERELIPMAQTYGLAILPWAPLAGGFLSGRYRPGQAAPAAARLTSLWKNAPSHLTPEAFAVLAEVERLAREKACTPSQIALAWCLAQPGVTAVLLGPRTLAHLEDHLMCLRVQLTPADLERLDAVAPPYRMTVPYSGVDGFAWVPWGPHRQRW
jgi:aryl-alcohol dehydrogenase-like predicted oxidoreductase